MLKFNEETHQYFLGDKELISVTTLMRKHGLAPSYDAVPSEVLKAKAERGTLIHKEIEDYIKTGEIGFTNELVNFINQPKGNIVASELMVHNDIVAGTLDLLIDEGFELIIADIKTTAQIHKEAVSWQLSIYKYLSGKEITLGQVYHFDKEGNLNVITIPLKPMEEIEKLMECERKGEIYKQELKVNDSQLTQLYEIEALIKGIEEQKKQAELKALELRSALLEAMEQNGVSSFENENIKLTYIAPSVRTNIDSAKLKKEMPQIAEKYTKQTNVKASLRITLKGA